MRHIGNMDPDFQVSAFQLLDTQGIIKVFGIFRVDGKREHIAEIPSAFNFLIRHRFRNGIGFPHRFFGVRQFKSGIYQDFFHLKIVSTYDAQHFSDRAHGYTAIAFLPIGNFNNDFIIVFGGTDLLQRNVHINGHVRIVGVEQRVFAVQADGSDKKLVGAFEYP